MKSIILHDRTYGADIRVLIMPKPEWAPYLKRNFKYSSETIIGFNGLHLSLENKQKDDIKHLIFLTKWNWTCRDMGMLAHEMNHCCFAVLRDAMVPLSKDTEEPHCYYHSAMLTQAFWRLRKFHRNYKRKKK